MMTNKLKIVTTSDLYAKSKQTKQKILVTQDLADEAIHHEADDSKPTTIVKTSDAKEGKDEKEE